MIDLFIHIGAPKTGTTAIQQYLTRHRRALLEYGTLYPEAGKLNTGHHRIGAAIFAERGSRLRGGDRDEVLAEAVAAIRAEIAASGARRVIVSSEYLWGEQPIADVRRLLDGFVDCRLHVVAYLRRQDLLAQSLYMQAVKGGATRSFDDWYAKDSGSARAGLHFDRVLRCWIDAGLPVDPVVRIYESGQIDRDVVRDFMAAVCPDVPFAAADHQSVNSTADLVTIELLRRVNALIRDKAQANALRRRILGATPPRTTFAPIDYLSGAQVGELMARHAAGNSWIARDLLGRVDGQLFRQPLPGADAAAHAVGDGAVLDRLIGLLPHMLPRTSDPDPDPASSPREIRHRRRREKIAAKHTSNGT